MNRAEIVKWVRAAGLSAVGGGIAGAFTASMDPARYNFPADLGSGRLWKYFFVGAGLTLGGMLLRSPLGQSAMQSYQNARAELEHAKQDIDKAKAALKPPSGPAGT